MLSIVLTYDNQAFINHPSDRATSEVSIVSLLHVLNEPLVDVAPNCIFNV